MCFLIPCLQEDGDSQCHKLAVVRMYSGQGPSAWEQYTFAFNLIQVSLLTMTVHCVVLI